MNVFITVLIVTYLVAGAALFFWVQADDLRKERLGAIHLIGSTSMMSGFTVVLFFMLWPVWAVAYWKRGKRDNQSSSEPTDTQP